MPAWTQVDADIVRAAIVKLAAGERTVSISYTSAGGTTRSATYGQANLDELRKLLAEMEKSLGGSPRYRRVAFSKGFNRG